jgi:CBS domain-containing protein
VITDVPDSIVEAAEGFGDALRADVRLTGSPVNPFLALTFGLPQPDQRLCPFGSRETRLLNAGSCRQVMRMKTVKDVMSAPAVWVSETASFREIVTKLRECRVSAFPVLDADGKAIGVVSEADLLLKEAVADKPNVVRRLLAGIVHHAARAKAGGVTAADLMTSPAVTIGPDEKVEHAAKLMYDRKVKRLPVVDRAGRLVGIISRSDVLAVFDRTDAEIREEIMSQVIIGRSEPSWYSVIVKDGVVTLEGTPETVAIGRDLVRRVHHVQGVVAVRDRLVYPVPPVPSRTVPYF